MDIAQSINFKIIQLGEDCFQKIKMFHVEHFQNYKISDNSLKNYLTLQQYKVFGAVDDFENILGYVVFLSSLDEADVIYICVNSRYRRNGIASKLIMAAINNSHDTCRDIRKIFIEVAVDNFAAINFYKKLDFEILFVRKNYTTSETGKSIDSYAMAKNIL